MIEKKDKAPEAALIVVILAILALLALQISKKPTSLSTATPSPEISISPTPTPSLYTTPMPTLSLEEIGTGLKDLNSSAGDIDKGLDDKQLDVLN